MFTGQLEACATYAGQGAGGGAQVTLLRSTTDSGEHSVKNNHEVFHLASVTGKRGFMERKQKQLQRNRN